MVLLYVLIYLIVGVIAMVKTVDASYQHYIEKDGIDLEPVHNEIYVSGKDKVSHIDIMVFGLLLVWPVFIVGLLITNRLLIKDIKNS